MTYSLVTTVDSTVGESIFKVKICLLLLLLLLLFCLSVTFFVHVLR